MVCVQVLRPDAQGTGSDLTPVLDVEILFVHVFWPGISHATWNIFQKWCKRTLNRFSAKEGRQWWQQRSLIVLTFPDEEDENNWKRTLFCFFSNFCQVHVEQKSCCIKEFQGIHTIYLQLKHIFIHTLRWKRENKKHPLRSLPSADPWTKPVSEHPFLFNGRPDMLGFRLVIPKKTKIFLWFGSKYSMIIFTVPSVSVYRYRYFMDFGHSVVDFAVWQSGQVFEN